MTLPCIWRANKRGMTTVDQILDGAEEVLLTNGKTGLTLNAVAESRSAKAVCSIASRRKNLWRVAFISDLSSKLALA